MDQPVRMLLRFLFAGLLLVLLVALGTEVAALHRRSRPVPDQPAAPVVVRKSAAAPPARKSVHSVRHRAG